MLDAQFYDLIQSLWGGFAGAMAAGDPPGMWSLAHSRRRAPADDAPPAERLFQYVADFNAFRDDCHMAAWRRLGVAGYVWEALALVADGTGPTADALFMSLSYRGYSVADYAAALDELAARGWAAPAADGWQVTGEGRTVRAAAEQRTDAAFYAPWAHLPAAGVLAIRDDIVSLNQQLTDAA